MNHYVKLDIEKCIVIIGKLDKLWFVLIQTSSVLIQ